MIASKMSESSQKGNSQNPNQNHQFQKRQNSVQEYPQSKRNEIMRCNSISLKKQINSTKVQSEVVSEKANEIIKQIKLSLRLLEKNLINKYKTQSLESKKIKSQKYNQIFRKEGYKNFGKKFRRIMIFLGSNQQNELLQIKKAKYIFKWLIKLFKSNNKQEFIDNANQKQKKFVQKNIKKLYSTKNLTIGDDNLIQQQKQISKWIEQFSLKHNLLQNFLSKSDFSQNKQKQIENFEQMPIKIAVSQQLVFKRRKKIIQEKNKALEQKISRKNQQIKIQEISQQIGKDNLKMKALRLKKIKCPNPNCNQELEEKKCKRSNHMILICDKCNSSDHICKQNKENTVKQNYFNEIKIRAIGNRMQHYSLKRVTATKYKNNILEVIQNLQYEFIIEPKIIPGTPKEIICNYPILSQEVYEQIMKNRMQQNYLPLQIKQSEIEGAGLGVFVTEDIKRAGTLICSYLGQIGNGSATPALRMYEGKNQMNNSFFTLGWLNDDIMLIAPNFFTNVGRFINYNAPSKCNLQASLCLLEKSKNKYELAVFLTTTRKIRAGQQLFYNYGPDY